MQQSSLRFRIHVSPGIVKPSQSSIVQQRINQRPALFVAATLAAGLRPFSFAENDGDLRIWIRVNKRFAALPGFLEVWERKAGIYGEKCSARISRLDVRAALAAFRSRLVAEDAHQLRGVSAIGNADYAIVPCQIREFPGLLHVSPEENQKFGGTAAQAGALISDQKNVAGEQRHHFFVAGFLADSCDPQEGTQRAGNGSC